MMKSKRLLIAAGAIALALLGWVGAALVFLLFEPTLAQWTLTVTVAAVLSEIALWIGVAVLGISALQRLRLWNQFRRVR